MNGLVCELYLNKTKKEQEGREGRKEGRTGQVWEVSFDFFSVCWRRQLKTQGHGGRGVDSEHGCTLPHGRPRNVIFYHWLGLKLIGSVLSARLAGRTRVNAEPAGGSRGPHRPTDNSSGGLEELPTPPVSIFCPFIYPSESPEKAPNCPGPKPGRLLPSGRGKHGNLPPGPPEFGVSTVQPWTRTCLPITFPDSYLVSCPLPASHPKTAQWIFLNPKLSPAPPCSEQSMAPQCLKVQASPIACKSLGDLDPRGPSGSPDPHPHPVVCGLSPTTLNCSGPFPFCPLRREHPHWQCSTPLAPPPFISQVSAQTPLPPGRPP